MRYERAPGAAMVAGKAAYRRHRSAVTALICVLASTTTAASATDCTQERAVYTDSANAYELNFEPVEQGSSASSHLFKIKVLNTKLVLDGYVMTSEPVERTHAILFNNCPDGDVTGDDIAACTVWDGIVYANDKGKLALLPQQGAAAAPEILLAGFGPALVDSSAWGAGKATVTPWDAFALKGCPS